MAEANSARPITAGGTGGATLSDARTNLGIPDLADEAKAVAGEDNTDAMTPLRTRQATDYYLISADRAYAGESIDAYDYLQDLLDEAAATKGERRALVRIDAHFRCSDMLVVPDGVDIEAGPDGVIDVSGVSMLTAIVAVETTGTKIRGLRVIGSGEGSQPDNAESMVASDVRLAGSGIIFAGVQGGVIENCVFDECGGTTGVAPYNGVAAIWLTYGCTECLVQGNRITDSRNGINEDNFFMQEPRGNKIVNNWVSGCRFGVALDSANASDTLVSGNTIKDCQQSGIDLNKARSSKVIGNYIENCGIENGNHGIWLYGTSGIPAFDNVIMGNTIYSCFGSGIKVGPHSYYDIVSDNICRENEKHGIFLIGPARHWCVSGNRCRGNDLNGLYIFKEGSSLVTTGTMTGNYALDNGQNGILLDGASEIAVAGNVAKSNSVAASNTHDGIRLTNGVTFSTFTGNHSSGADQRYALSCADSDTLGNAFNGNIFIAGTTGRIAFANLNQYWGDNGDSYTGTSGEPTGTFPNGAQVFNNGDNTLYTRRSDGTWSKVYMLNGTSTRGDVNLALNLTHRPNQRFNSALSVDRTVTLPAGGGRDYTISRTAIAGGVGKLSVMDGATLIKELAAGQWAEFSYDPGTAVWVVSKSGTLI